MQNLAEAPTTTEGPATTAASDDYIADPDYFPGNVYELYVVSNKKWSHTIQMTNDRAVYLLIVQ